MNNKRKKKKEESCFRRFLSEEGIQFDEIKSYSPHYVINYFHETESVSFTW
jgi:hypothetical protein